MKRSKIKKISVIAATLLLSFMTIIPDVVSVLSGSAETYTLSENAFDDTDVLTDLSGRDLSAYTTTDGNPTLVEFMEYEYSDAKVKREHFALYIYIYNPQRVEISTRVGANTVNMATEYDAEGNPTAYANLDLKVCSYSTGTAARQFYKFRVYDERMEQIEKNAYTQSQTSRKREYSVAGIQFWKKGAASATVAGGVSSVGVIESGTVKDYSISKTFIFTGFAQGFGTSEISTLKSTAEDLTTISLDVRQTNWRNDTSYKNYTYEEVNTAYFSVPEEYFTYYGNLQGIKAEWDEYRTNPIFVATNDEYAYGDILPYVGKAIGEYDTDCPWRVLWEMETNASMWDDVIDRGNIAVGKDWNRLCRDNWNDYFISKAGIDVNIWKTILFPWWLEGNDLWARYVFSGEYLPEMDWLFERLGTTDELCEVSRNDVEEFAKNWIENFGGSDTERILSNAGTEYAANLFADSIDADRIELLQNKSAKRGYMNLDFDANDEYNLLQKDNYNTWNSLLVKLGLKKNDAYVARSYTPIEVLNAKDEKVSTWTKGNICDKYMIGKNDYTDFETYTKSAFDNNNRLVLFRFANTDYYFSEARFDKTGDGAMSSVDGYVAQESVFLGFDIIDLTFKKGETITVIACVSDPIDIWNGTTIEGDFSGTFVKDNSKNWRIFFAIVMLCLVVFFVLWLIVKIRGNHVSIHYKK